MGVNRLQLHGDVVTGFQGGFRLAYSLEAYLGNSYALRGGDAPRAGDRSGIESSVRPGSPFGCKQAEDQDVIQLRIWFDREGLEI